VPPPPIPNVPDGKLTVFPAETPLKPRVCAASGSAEGWYTSKSVANFSCAVGMATPLVPHGVGSATLKQSIIRKKSGLGRIVKRDAGHRETEV
jgi:hypothetical protein